MVSALGKFRCMRGGKGSKPMRQEQSSGASDRGAESRRGSATRVCSSTAPANRSAGRASASDSRSLDRCARSAGAESTTPPPLPGEQPIDWVRREEAQLKAGPFGSASAAFAVRALARSYFTKLEFLRPSGRRRLCGSGNCLRWGQGDDIGQRGIRLRKARRFPKPIESREAPWARPSATAERAVGR